MFAGLNRPDKTSARPQASPGNESPARKVARKESNPIWQRLALVPGAIQTKLTISQPGDAYEREADQVADLVMRAPASKSSEPSLAVSSPRSLTVQRKCGECAEEESLQRKETGKAEPATAASSLVEGPHSSGQPLDHSTLSFMQERFGHNFSDVRIHHNSEAADAARSVNALAYTVGRDVVFADGQFSPTTRDGQRLLAHELVHTIQQGDGPSQPDGIARSISKKGPSVDLLQRAADCQGDKPVDPDTLGPLFVKKKSDVEKSGLKKHKVKPQIEGLPYVLFSPHCPAGKVPLKSLVDGGDAYLISSGQIYKQVWAQQEGKSADQTYWGWVNPKLIESVAAPSTSTPAATEPPKTDPPAACPPAGAQPETPALPPLTAQPSVTCAPGLSGHEAIKCFSESVREEVRHRSEGDIYQAQLKHAVELLQRAGFGRLEGHPVQFDPSSPPEWEDETYNKDFWKAEDHPKFLRKLVLKPGKEPSAAIDDMFANLGKWKVDCGQFVQVAHLYALRHALGTKGFNQMNSGSVAFELKPQGSTALRRVKFYERFKPGAPMVRHPEKTEDTKSADELLKEAPVGSRIMWTNLEASLASAYRNENTLKLGDDQFAAHGFMKDLKKNVLTRKELEQALAKFTTTTPDDEYLKAHVFISEIEHYQMPQNPKP